MGPGPETGGHAIGPANVRALLCPLPSVTDRFLEWDGPGPTGPGDRDKDSLGLAITLLEGVGPCLMSQRPHRLGSLGSEVQLRWMCG